MKVTFTTTLSAIVLLATAQTFSKVEINPLQGTEQFLWADSSKHVYGAGELSSFVEMNGVLYFVGQDTYYNYELWATDGTQQGTHVVKELNQYGGAYIGKLYKVGNRLLFAATEDSGSVWDTKFFDLYVSDGTAQGTFKLADLDEWDNSFLESSRVVTFNNKLVFCSSTHIMVSDGTVSGTKQLAPISQYAQGFGYCELNGKVYFLLQQNSGLQVWSTDGTIQGTIMMKNLTSSSPSLNYATDMKAHSGKLYIAGAPSGQGSDLYVYDGNPNGAVTKVQLTNVGSAYPSQLHLYNNRLWMVAHNQSNINLYVINANHQAMVVSTSAHLPVYGELASGNNRVYFADAEGKTIYSVAAENDYQLQQIDLGDKRLPSYWVLGSSFLIAKNGNIYFAVYDSTGEQQYFAKSNGTTVETFLPATTNVSHPFNMIVSCGMADVFDFALFNNKIVVPANFDNSGRELWLFEDDDLSPVREIETLQKLTVFPNPASDNVTIVTGQGNYCQTNIVILDVNGKTILKTTGSESNVRINTSALTAGEYIGILHQEGKAKGIARFVITR
ncbi:MAG: T9SS type A sorting domain-containing protein [Chitinophagales bacterium]|nr:T9SS type A sorting domain-containing protein [Chitinophagales bacterium]